jgi:hypothetical protein
VRTRRVFDVGRGAGTAVTTQGIARVGDSVGSRRRGWARSTRETHGSLVVVVLVSGSRRKTRRRQRPAEATKKNKKQKKKKRMSRVCAGLP